MGNRQERLAWFADQALGMFIHWSVDCPLGLIISHSMVGASQDYLERYIGDLPGLFAPEKFNPRAWARLARTAGMRYAVFAAKHHNGFCMWDTQTTHFNVMNTPFGQDVVRGFADAFRNEGLAVGLYFSPDDFWYCHTHGIPPSRMRPESLPSANPGLMEHNQAQLRELLTGYGPVDVLFFDIKRERPEDLNRLAWKLQPHVVVTRGAMQTPEQELPDEVLPRPWEACYTIGHAWQHRPTNEEYKSGTRLIELFIQTRARGGNLLLNVGPNADGEIPDEQVRPLRELALWHFIHAKALHEVEPWDICRQDDVWFTKERNGPAVYAFCTGEAWPGGEWKTVTLKGVALPPAAEVELVGQSGDMLEYRPEIVPKARWEQDENGLHVTAMRAVRLYNDRRWPNPVVIRLPEAEVTRP